MTGALHSVFQNFRSSVKIIAVDLLVVGGGGGGAAGRYGTGNAACTGSIACSGGLGGNAATAGYVSSSSNRTKINQLLTIQVGLGGVRGSPNFGTCIPGTYGGNSSISGFFVTNTGLSANGGVGASAAGGGTGGTGLSTISSAISNSITGTSLTYGNGASGGAFRSNLNGGDVNGTTNLSNRGNAGGGGGGGMTHPSFAWSGLGAIGGHGDKGCVIMRCRQDAYTTYTATNATVTTISISSVTYTVFTWISSGTITFT